MAASTQWRVRCLSNSLGAMSDYYLGLAEIEMAADFGGSNLCYSGTPGASTGSNPERAFDGVTNSPTNEWKGYGWSQHWIGYTLPTLIEIVEFRLWPCVSTIYSSPTLMAFEYNDGENWVISWIGYSGTWTPGVVKTFRKPNLGLAPQRWWALNVVTTQGMGDEPNARYGGELVNLYMREIPGGTNLSDDPMKGGGNAWDNATEFDNFEPKNVFDEESVMLGEDVNYWYYSHSGAESILYYDFGAGNAKQITEMSFVRIGGAGVQYSPQDVRVLKSADGTNWLVHSTHKVENDDYNFSTGLATIGAVSELDTEAEVAVGIDDAAIAFIIAVGAGMARIYADRVMETTVSVGTGDITVAGAVAGFQAFDGVLEVGDTFDYAVFAVDTVGRPTGAWETGRATYTATNTIERTEVHESSNGDDAVDFAAGTKQIILSHNARSANDHVKLTQAEYDGLVTKDADTFYYIVEE